jgi:hypothetical protein
MARRPLNSQKRRFPARAVLGCSIFLLHPLVALIVTLTVGVVELG